MRQRGYRRLIPPSYQKRKKKKNVIEGDEDVHGSGNNPSGIDMNNAVRRLCSEGRLNEALHILDVLDHRGLRAASSAYASLLQECAHNKALPEGKLIHAHMVDTGIDLGMFLCTKLVIMYAKCGSLVDARQIFDEMPKRNAVSWTAMIAAYVRHGHDEGALSLYYQMQRAGIQPNQFTFASVLPACANLGALKRGKVIHEDVTRRGFQSDIFVGSSLVDMYAKCGRVHDARQVFDEMPERNVVSWNAMIAGYAQNGHADEAMKLFYKMPERDVVSWNAMIVGYAQNGEVDKALNFFWKMPGRDVVSWNEMIAAYVQTGRVDDALKCFQQMPERDGVSWTSMIAGHAQNGQVDEALKLFQKMPEWSVVSWSAMIAGHAQNANFNEALKLFRQMQLSGLKPISDIFASVLGACANLAALRIGKEVHEHIIRSGLQSGIFVGSALVDMYAKCGNIDDASKVFDKMPEQDVVSWTTMIVGYAMHGCGKEALQLFEQMQHSGLKPDRVSFLGVLSACCHAGLVDDGWQYFKCMKQYYRIAPEVEHFCCMVDLLGRAGRLDEAQEFINRMPIKPSVTVWGSLLGACRIHTNIELGERVAKHFFELEPKSASSYVLLSNIYAAAGRWNDVENVRKLMKDWGVKKLPGCSWIEINNNVHSFLVGDSSPQRSTKFM